LYSITHKSFSPEILRGNTLTVTQTQHTNRETHSETDRQTDRQTAKAQHVSQLLLACVNKWQWGH